MRGFGRSLGGLFVVIALGLFALASPLPVRAASPLAFVVTNRNETPAADANCVVINCSLRQAVNASNGNDPGVGNHNTITFTNGLTGTITLTNGVLDLMRNVTIDGTGATIAVDTSHAATAFQVDAGATLNALIIQNSGSVVNPGGGIENFGILTVTNSVFSGNTGESIGGGIENFGTLTVTNSALIGNSAPEGGGIFNGGTLTVTNSAFANNSVPSSGSATGGGGIANGPNSSAFLTNTTFSGNTDARGGGGGIYNISSATMFLTNCTLFNNSALGAARGGGILNRGTLTLTNTLIASSPTGGDIQQEGVLTGTNNLIDDPAPGTGFSDSLSGNIINHPALLGPQGTYGSANGTQTFPLLPGSPAIDAGTSSGPPSNDVLATDQRAKNRLNAPDIGAFESQGFTLTPGTGSGQVTNINHAFPTPLTATITANQSGEPVDGGTITYIVPPSGPSATLSANPVTIAGGAVSVTATANGTAGPAYFVGLSTRGATAMPSAFTLTNYPLPVANADSYSVNEDGSLSVSGVNSLLVNDSAGPGPLATTLFGPGPAHHTGAFTLNVDGTFTYTPTANFSGSDSFSYVVTDSLGNVSPPATVTITINLVNDQPSFTASNPPAVPANSGAQTVSNWATFNPGPGANEATQTVLAYTISTISNPVLFATPPAVALNGTLTYTPAPNSAGTSTFDVTAQDGGGTLNGGIDTSLPQTFTITVNTVAPTATNDAYSTPVNTTLTVSAASGVLANDTLGVPAATISAHTTPSHGTLTLNGDGSFTYTPANSFVGTDTFTYTATNTAGTSPAATVTITVTNVLQTTTLTCGATDARIPVGGTGQCTATGHYADGSTQTLTSGVTYTTSDPNVATVDPATGKITGTATGTATITVHVGNVQTTLTVTVYPPSVTGVIPPGQRPTGANVSNPAASPAPDSRGSGSPAAPPAPIPGR